MNNNVDETTVSNVNRKFYDQIAGVYDSVDSRRNTGEEHRWLDAVLTDIKDLANETGLTELTLLDAGAGSGFLSYKAQDYFPNLILLDISPKMLERIDIPDALKLEGDCGEIPLDEDKVDIVGAFATLHHLYNPEKFFKEAHRVLKPGGILYTDHDIEQNFVKKFNPLLKVYRYFFDHGHGYLKACPELTEEEYHLTEYHGDTGLDGKKLADSLRELGFEVVREQYHWEGMGIVAKIFEKLGLTKIFKGCGKAPVVRLIARKR